MQWLEVLAILKVGRKKFPLFKKGGGEECEKFYSVLRGGGGAKKFQPELSPFCSPPPRN